MTDVVIMCILGTVRRGRVVGLCRASRSQSREWNGLEYRDATNREILGGSVSVFVLMGSIFEHTIEPCFDTGFQCLAAHV